MKYILFSFLLFTISCQQGNKPTPVTETAPAPPVKVTIPFSFGFNNHYFPSDSTLITVYDSKDSLVFVHKGYKPFWGLQKKGMLGWTGKYKVHMIFYPDSLTKKESEEFFDITGDEESIDLVVNLIKIPGGRSNEVYVNKYFGNKYHVQLTRVWDPIKQKASKKELLPEYQWSNPYDSTIFGIYRQFSSSSMIHYVRYWNIAYMQFQQYRDSGWMQMGCNAPRMEAEIKKGQTGNTLKDMVLSCPARQFTKKGKYRVLVEYGINDALYRHTKANGRLDSSFYYEPHIYQVADEFSIQRH
jgi:hypothetical protein